MSKNNLQPKIIFFGTPQFSVTILEALMKNNYSIIAIVTAPDQPAGRGRQLQSSPVKMWAQQHNLFVYAPQKVKEIQEQLKQLAPDLIILAAYGQIIPKEILEIPPFGCLNVHPSLLPMYRGPAPIQTAILDGAEKTGVTVLLMDEKMDHGPILNQISTEIASQETAASLLKKLANLGAELLIQTIPAYLQKKITPQPQDDTKASFTKLLAKEDGCLNWEEPAIVLERKIRAFYPWPGTYTFWQKSPKQKMRLKIIQATLGNEAPANSSPGQIFLYQKDVIASPDEYRGEAIPLSLAIVCGDQKTLLIQQLQPEGKKIMTGKEFCQGYRQIIGQMLY